MGFLLTSQDIALWMQRDPHFIGVFAQNQLPIKVPPIPNVIKLVLNTDCDNLDGRHWIAFMRHPSGEGEIFDSFGLYPPARLQLWCNKHSLKWKHNTQCIQKINTNLCGTYCCLFLTSRHKFNDLFSCVKHLSDVV